MDIAKICYISSKKTATEAVEGHKEELRLHRKVWSGFTKYIRSQCDKKQKYFSCPFIGKFGPVPDQDSETKRYRFVPSVDFIESASFKYEENDYNLSPFVDLKSEKVVVMSPSSIAQVCDTTKTKVIEVLKAIFATIIELSKSDKQLCLDLKIGFLNVEQSRRLYFSNTQDQSNTNNKNMNNLTADNISTVPRSIGPNSVYSYKSNFSTMRSVKTPMTVGKSSVRSKMSSKWSLFRRNNPKSQVRRPDDHYSYQSGNQLNYTSPVQVSTPDKPYPHLANFIKKQTEYRFGKRMGKAENLTQKNVMEEQLKQIHEKNFKEQEEDLKQREEELKEYLSLANDNEIEAMKKIELINKRKEFLKDIEDLKKQKALKYELERANSREYEYNYFPFTHGDNIERKRKMITEEMKNQMKEHYKNKKTEFLEDALSQKSSSKQSNHRSLSNSTGDVFLKPHKQHYLRHINAEQQEDTNKKALKKYEEELMKQNMRKGHRPASQTKALPQISALTIEDQKLQDRERHLAKMKEMKKVLGEQFREKEEQRLQEFLDRKRVQSTSFGPQEDDEFRQILYKQRTDKIKMLGKEIKNQIDSKKMVYDASKNMQMEVEKHQNKNINKFLADEALDAKQRKEKKIKENLKNWDQQQKAKAILENISI
ncbi:unnamed protein product [Moneuplotes crassus]|uniref:CCDC81 HU domain-containing protein n=3 Tax=Euplotes crassus TaxID=5936 RepID=A0AAD1X0N2_EUPCR|nr:unnamed protein product [Moneuplotes crassus]